MQYRSYFKNQGHQLDTPIFYPLRDADPPGWIKILRKISGINAWRILDAIKKYKRRPLLQMQNSYDFIWQNRLVLPHHDYFENRFKKPVAFDFDDAIWINEGRKQVENAIGKASVIFAGNEFLANFAANYNKNIQVVPTTVDTEIIKPLRRKDRPFTLGWIGTKSNFEWLEIIKQPVLDFLSANNDTRFVIVSSEKPSLFSFDEKKIIFMPWDKEKENELINEFDVGLMPLDDNEWTRGKCSYKMLQYLAGGKPAIVSPVGNNNKIIAQLPIKFKVTDSASWLKTFKQLKADSALYDACSKNGRKLVEENYSCKVWSPKIITLFRNIS